MVFELKSSDGVAILSFNLHAGEGLVLANRAGTKTKPGKKSGAKGKGKNGKNGNNGNNNGALMTDPQQRYLFRLLANQGIEGDEAHEHLKEHFQVDSLKKVSKFEAGKMIKRLLEEAENGG